MPMGKQLLLLSLVVLTIAAGLHLDHCGSVPRRADRTSEEACFKPGTTCTNYKNALILQFVDALNVCLTVTTRIGARTWLY